MRLITHEAQNTAKASGNTTTGKRGTRKEALRERNTTPLNSDGKNDDKYRAFHTFHGWTKEYCRYLDDLTTIGISYIATWKQRSRSANSLVLVVNDGPHPGPKLLTNLQLARLQLSNVNKEESFLISQNDSESGNAHSMNNCYQILSGKVGIG